MKKDIEVPKVEGVHVAAIREKNEDFRTLDWNAYIINDRNVPLEMVLVITRGFDEKNSTSTMRHSIKVLPAKSYAKIEFLQDEVLSLTNEFLVTYFEDNRMYERKFTFRKNSVRESALGPVPVIPEKGILAK